jgi:hypothetical protein
MHRCDCCQRPAAPSRPLVATWDSPGTACLVLRTSLAPSSRMTPLMAFEIEQLNTLFLPRHDHIHWCLFAWAKLLGSIELGHHEVQRAEHAVLTALCRATADLRPLFICMPITRIEGVVGLLLEGRHHRHHRFHTPGTLQAVGPKAALAPEHPQTNVHKAGGRLRSSRHTPAGFGLPQVCPTSSSRSTSRRIGRL